MFWSNFGICRFSVVHIEHNVRFKLQGLIFRWSPRSFNYDILNVNGPFFRGLFFVLIIFSRSRCVSQWRLFLFLQNDFGSQKISKSSAWYTYHMNTKENVSLCQLVLPKQITPIGQNVNDFWDSEFIMNPVPEKCSSVSTHMSIWIKICSIFACC